MRAAERSCPDCSTRYGPDPDTNRFHQRCPRCERVWKRRYWSGYYQANRDRVMARQAAYRLANRHIRLAGDARYRGAETVELFTPESVFWRDRWRCQLCRQPIDRGLRWPHPGSATIDHVTPISRGGAHAFSNVQAAHLSCNRLKSSLRRKFGRV